jgi:hypothetical protein
MKLNYQLMTTEELRKYLRRHSMPTSGDRNVLIQRCKSIEPLPEDDKVEDSISSSESSSSFSSSSSSESSSSSSSNDDSDI